MSVSFRCPHCGRETLVADEYIGQEGPCAGCGRTVVVPPTAGEALCPQCHAPVAIGAASCSQCGTVFRGARGQEVGDSAAIRMLIPVGRSGLAIAAGYAGLISVLVFPAPIAIILGILAIRDLNRHPEKHGMGRAIFGLVMGVLVILSFLLLLTWAWG